MSPSNMRSLITRDSHKERWVRTGVFGTGVLPHHSYKVRLFEAFLIWSISSGYTDRRGKCASRNKYTQCMLSALHVYSFEQLPQIQSLEFQGLLGISKADKREFHPRFGAS